MSDKERDISDGLAIIELERSEGWQIIERKVREEIDQMSVEQEGIEIQGRPLQDIATEYIRISERRAGLRRVLEMVEDIKKGKEDAEHD